MNLFENLKGQFSGENLRDLVRILNESEDGIRAGVHLSLSIALGKIFRMVEEDGLSRRALQELLRAEEERGASLLSVASVVTKENVEHLLSIDPPSLEALFRGEQSSLIELVAEDARIKLKSAAALFRIVVPLALGTISQILQEQQNPKNVLQNLARAQLELIQDGLRPELKHSLNLPEEKLEHRELPSWATLVGILTLVSASALFVAKLRSDHFIQALNPTAEVVQGRARLAYP